MAGLAFLGMGGVGLDLPITAAAAVDSKAADRAATDPVNAVNSGKTVLNAEITAAAEAASLPPPGPSRAPASAVLSTDLGEASRLRWSPEASVALPLPLQLGASVASIDHPALHVYANVGYFRMGLNSGTRAISIYGLETGGRWYPGEGAFFAAAGFGVRHVGLRVSGATFNFANGSPGVTSGTIALTTPYFCPKIGMDFKLSRRLSLGFDLGVQLPFFASGSLALQNANTGADSDTSSLLQVNSSIAMARVAGLILPQITLFRFEYHLD